MEDRYADTFGDTESLVRGDRRKSIPIDVIQLIISIRGQGSSCASKQRESIRAAGDRN